MKGRRYPPARKLSMNAVHLASYAPSRELSFLCEGMMPDPEMALEAVGTLMLMGEVPRGKVPFLALTYDGFQAVMRPCAEDLMRAIERDAPASEILEKVQRFVCVLVGAKAVTHFQNMCRGYFSDVQGTFSRISLAKRREIQRQAKTAHMAWADPSLLKI